jgi:hypothetical protein
MNEQPSTCATSATQSTNTSEKPHPSEFLEFTTLGPSKIPDAVSRRTEGAEHGSRLDHIHRTETNDALYQSLIASVPGYRRMSIEARAATSAEHKMSLSEGIRLYPKAIAWSILLSCTIIMEGYDTALITAFFAFPVFRRSYGTKVPGTSDYQISPPLAVRPPRCCAQGRSAGFGLQRLPN